MVCSITGFGIVFILGTYVLTAEVRQEAPWTIMCGGDIVFFGGFVFVFSCFKIQSYGSPGTNCLMGQQSVKR